MLRRLTRPLWIALALVFLFEAWLWNRLVPVVGAFVRLIAWRRLRQRIADTIEGLPPYPTLLVFLIPIALLLPLKFLGLWMLAHGSWLGALAVLALAKIVSVGVTAFIFDITRPKLMQLAWFARLYAWVMRGLAWAHALIDPVKAEVRDWIAVRLHPAMQRLRALTRQAVARPGGGFFRHLARVRRRLQGH